MQALNYGREQHTICFGLVRAVLFFNLDVILIRRTLINSIVHHHKSVRKYIFACSVATTNIN
jgi:hypothetical protein